MLGGPKWAWHSWSLEEATTCIGIDRPCSEQQKETHNDENTTRYIFHFLIVNLSKTSSPGMPHSKMQQCVIRNECPNKRIHQNIVSVGKVFVASVAWQLRDMHQLIIDRSVEANARLLPNTKIEEFCRGECSTASLLGCEADIVRIECLTQIR